MPITSGFWVSNPYSTIVCEKADLVLNTTNQEKCRRSGAYRRGLLWIAVSRVMHKGDGSGRGR